MPRIDYKSCRNCGGHAHEVGTLSHTRLCAACGDKLRRSEVHQLIDHSGPEFENWRRRMAASVGAICLDDVAPAT